MTSPSEAKKHGWVFESDEKYQGFVLYDRGSEQYDIELGKCKTSAGVLDWIFQLWAKTWIRQRPEILIGFIKIVGETLRPQHTLCSWGAEKGPVDWAVELPRLEQAEAAIRGMVERNAEKMKGWVAE
jgi:hypothetical protein